MADAPHEIPAPPPGHAAWPRISIVTPSYNQAQFLERTILSVLGQGYPDVEYFVMDGGSTDGSAAIIQKYAPQFAAWASEPDRGQTEAINKGWSRATGEIIAWINSDDWYCEGAFFAVARAFLENPSAQWVHGEVLNTKPDGSIAKHHRPAAMTIAQCLGRHRYAFHQPGMFWRRSLVQRVGLLEVGMHYSFDHDLWLRMMLDGAEPLLLARPVAHFQLHGESKSYGARHGFTLEDRKVFARHAPKLPPAERAQAMRWLRENEADVFIDTIYALLAKGHRASAARIFLGNLRLLPLLRPRRAGLGLAWRALVTGRPPAWFRTHA